MKPLDRLRRTHLAGQWAEWRAMLALRLKFYALVAARWRCPAGEIDLIVRPPFWGVKSPIVFVEVKARADMETAGEALTARQRSRIARAAAAFIAARPALHASPVRFDVVLLVPGSWPLHIRDAWQAEA
ncbi:MAG: YraN family protein [Alphaproteobacteria bacterium]|nr:YraN family protein [Alphaproteobacteria bacterium]